jgi:antirestriction protein ArdC
MKKEQFPSAENYYSTLLHEVGHNADSRIMPRRMLGTHQSLGNPTRLLGII